MILFQFNFDRSILTDGLIISLIGYLVVLLALGGLYYTFRYLPRLLTWRVRFKLRSRGKEVNKDEDHLPIVADVGAAIATALYLYFDEVHDEEYTIMTIKKVSKTYSPWSSKIFGVTNRLRR